MKIIAFLITSVILLYSCTRASQKNEELLAHLNTKLNLNQFEYVMHKDSIVSFQRFREKNTYLSVVYLQEGCTPCYPKYVEWHQKIGELDSIANYTVLFVIQTAWPDVFYKKIQEISDDIDEKFYVIIDPDHQFVINNSQIPDWILNSSILIDSENKIKMVGAPWINEDMKNLFYKTVSNEQ